MSLDSRGCRVSLNSRGNDFTSGDICELKKAIWLATYGVVNSLSAYGGRKISGQLTTFGVKEGILGCPLHHWFASTHNYLPPPTPFHAVLTAMVTMCQSICHVTPLVARALIVHCISHSQLENEH